MIMPAAAHRFVGYLEEEAVRTYSHCIQDIESNLVPEWYVLLFSIVACSVAN